MCDQDHFEEDFKKYSRRDMGALAALGVSAAIIFPSTANAAEVQESDVSIKTPDGEHRAQRALPRYRCFNTRR